MEEERNDQERGRLGAQVAAIESVCPVCGAALVQERCKVVCRSERCVYLIVFNCSEF